MQGDVNVTIINTDSLVKPAISKLEYEVCNETKTLIWLVDDGWLIWLQKDTFIELSYARGKMQPGVQVFGYFQPSVIKIGPAECISKAIELMWPLELNPIWNKKRWAALPPGKYQVSIRIGYGLTQEPALPKSGEGVEIPVLCWQKEAVSPEAELTVPYYIRSVE